MQVEEVVADRRTYVANPGLRLPPLTRDLEIDYAALSLSRQGRYFSATCLRVMIAVGRSRDHAGKRSTAISHPGATVLR